MKIHETISGVPLKEALDKIIKYSIKCSAPVLVVKEDDLKMEYGARSFFKSKADVYYVQMGIACSMNYIGHEISCHLNTSHRVLPKGRHSRPFKFIRNRMKLLSKPPVIVIDNCHHFVFEQLFHLIGLINMLDGLASFIFLLSEAYIDDWKQMRQPQLYYFNKIIDKVFRLEA
jgi:hypothetical protein